LIYRNVNQMAALKPALAPADACSIQADFTGVNLFVEIRKPENA